jgi:hypothetical protein
MTRLPNWQSLMQACLAERWALPFAWGTQDCCTLPCDVALAMSGTDPMADLRDTYSTKESAAAVIADAGGLIALAAARLDDEITPLRASVGDAGYHEVVGMPSLAVCAGPHWLTVGPKGIAVLAASHVTRAWRVG